MQYVNLHEDPYQSHSSGRRSSQGTVSWGTFAQIRFQDTRRTPLPCLPCFCPFLSMPAAAALQSKLNPEIGEPERQGWVNPQPPRVHKVEPGLWEPRGTW